MAPCRVEGGRRPGAEVWMARAGQPGEGWRCSPCRPEQTLVPRTPGDPPETGAAAARPGSLAWERSVEPGKEQGAGISCVWSCGPQESGHVTPSLTLALFKLKGNRESADISSKIPSVIPLGKPVIMPGYLGHFSNYEATAERSTGIGGAKQIPSGTSHLVLHLYQALDARLV